MGDVLVVGCGLLGTSIGLALRGSAWDDVMLTDVSSVELDTALARGAGRTWHGEVADVAVACVPPARTATVLAELQSREVARTYTHVASIQSLVQRDIERLSPDPSRVVGGHPLAGREVSGAAAAVADLFVGRPWAVCGTAQAQPGAVEDVRRLAELCGAVPMDVAPELHDSTVALTSHLPQVLATALAGRMLSGTAGPEPPSLSLSGQGLIDTTRLAASSPHLWAEILAANARQVGPALRALLEDLESVAAALQACAAAEGEPDATDTARRALVEFLERGNRGRALVPIKRGDVSGAFTSVRVELADAPGELARLLAAAGDAGVNVEDLRLEHVPGRPSGIVELLVGPSGAEPLGTALGTAGWHVFLSTQGGDRPLPG